MKSVIISIRNIIFAQGTEIALKKTGNFRTYMVSPLGNPDIAAECMSKNAEILLMDVGPQESESVDARLLIAGEARKLRPGIKVVLLCDEVAYPELAKQVMRTKQSGQIDSFYYTSVPGDYLVDALDAL